MKAKHKLVKLVLTAAIITDHDDVGGDRTEDDDDERDHVVTLNHLPPLPHLCPSAPGIERKASCLGVTWTIRRGWAAGIEGRIIEHEPGSEAGPAGLRLDMLENPGPGNAWHLKHLSKWPKSTNMISK